MGSISRHAYASSTKRYHPYVPQDQHRRCRFSDTSVSPSPPPTVTPETIGTAPLQIDLFSRLPQELIEEIGLWACVPSFTEDPSYPLLEEDLHRMRTLHALTLVSRQFYQIFTHTLYRHPLIIDTQFATASNYPNTAPKWVEGSNRPYAQQAQKFTFWRPPGDGLSPTHTFTIFSMLSNVREITFVGNFGSHFGSGWRPMTTDPSYLPHLRSVRIMDVDNAQLLNDILLGVAPNITSMVIQVAGEGLLSSYTPRSVCSQLRLTIENLSSLEYLSLTIPTLTFAINHCNHAHKLVQKTLSTLPMKGKLKHLSLGLPLFDCRSSRWSDDGSDSD